MSRLIETYRAIHEQAFVPIFGEDGFDGKKLVEACVDAGCKGIEYTLRKHDAHTMIPWIRENYPDLHLLVGSTLDGEAIVERARSRFPQLRKIKELVDMGVDGFVSMVGFTAETIERYAPTHLLISPASTVFEAFQVINAGAHFTKLYGPGLDLVRLCRNDAGFGFCPIFMTGGLCLERIPEAFEEGVVLVGSGFDLMLKNRASDLPVKEVSNVVKQYLETTQSAQARSWPELAAVRGSDHKTWLAAVPHHHPFDALV